MPPKVQKLQKLSKEAGEGRPSTPRTKNRYRRKKRWWSVLSVKTTWYWSATHIHHPSHKFKRNKQYNYIYINTQTHQSTHTTQHYVGNLQTNPPPVLLHFWRQTSLSCYRRSNTRPTFPQRLHLSQQEGRNLYQRPGAVHECWHTKGGIHFIACYSHPQDRNRLAGCQVRSQEERQAERGGPCAVFHRR